jgi:hypothetical protein
VSLTKYRDLPITPKGVKYYEFLQYCEEDQNFDAALAYNIELGNAKHYKEFLFENRSLPHTIYEKTNESDQRIISKFIAQAKVEVIKGRYLQEDVTHYIRG